MDSLSSDPNDALVFHFNRNCPDKLVSSENRPLDVSNIICSEGAGSETEHTAVEKVEIWVNGVKRVIFVPLGNNRTESCDQSESHHPIEQCNRSERRSPNESCDPDANPSSRIVADAKISSCSRTESCSSFTVVTCSAGENALLSKSVSTNTVDQLPNRCVATVAPQINHELGRLLVSSTLDGASKSTEFNIKETAALVKQERLTSLTNCLNTRPDSTEALALGAYMSEKQPVIQQRQPLSDHKRLLKLNEWLHQDRHNHLQRLRYDEPSRFPTTHGLTRSTVPRIGLHPYVTEGSSAQFALPNTDSFSGHHRLPTQVSPYSMYPIQAAVLASNGLGSGGVFPGQAESNHFSSALGMSEPAVVSNELCSNQSGQLPIHVPNVLEHLGKPTTMVPNLPLQRYQHLLATFDPTMRPYSYGRFGTQDTAQLRNVYAPLARFPTRGEFPHPQFPLSLSSNEQFAAQVIRGDFPNPQFPVRLPINEQLAAQVASFSNGHRFFGCHPNYTSSFVRAENPARHEQLVPSSIVSFNEQPRRIHLSEAGQHIPSVGIGQADRTPLNFKQPEAVPGGNLTLQRVQQNHPKITPAVPGMSQLHPLRANYLNYADVLGYERLRVPRGTEQRQPTLHVQNLVSHLQPPAAAPPFRSSLTVPAQREISQSTSIFQPVNREITQSTSIFQPVNREITQSTSIFQPVNREITQSTSIFQPVNREITQSTSIFQSVNHEITKSTSIFQPVNREIAQITSILQPVNGILYNNACPLDMPQFMRPDVPQFIRAPFDSTAFLQNVVSGSQTDSLSQHVSVPGLRLADEQTGSSTRTARYSSPSDILPQNTVSRSFWSASPGVPIRSVSENLPPGYLQRPFWFPMTNLYLQTQPSSDTSKSRRDADVENLEATGLQSHIPSICKSIQVEDTFRSCHNKCSETDTRTIPHLQLSCGASPGVYDLQLSINAGSSVSMELTSTNGGGDSSRDVVLAGTNSKSSKSAEVTFKDKTLPLCSSGTVLDTSHEAVPAMTVSPSLKSRLEPRSNLQPSTELQDPQSQAVSLPGSPQSPMSEIMNSIDKISDDLSMQTWLDSLIGNISDSSKDGFDSQAKSKTVDPAVINQSSGKDMTTAAGRGLVYTTSMAKQVDFRKSKRTWIGIKSIEAEMSPKSSIVKAKRRKRRRLTMRSNQSPEGSCDASSDSWHPDSLASSESSLDSILTSNPSPQDSCTESSWCSDDSVTIGRHSKKQYRKSDSSRNQTVRSHHRRTKRLHNLSPWCRTRPCFGTVRSCFVSLEMLCLKGETSVNLTTASEFLCCSSKTKSRTVQDGSHTEDSYGSWCSFRSKKRYRKRSSRPTRNTVKSGSETEDSYSSRQRSRNKKLLAKLRVSKPARNIVMSGSDTEGSCSLQERSKTMRHLKRSKNSKSVRYIIKSESDSEKSHGSRQPTKNKKQKALSSCAGLTGFSTG